MKNQIIILTGPPGAGKTTIGKALANSINKSVIVSTDTLRYFVKKGKAGIGDRDWEKQLSLGAKNACLLAKSFYREGFNVFLDDVICNKRRLDIYLKNLKGCKFKIILLLPKKDILIKRDLSRGKWAMKERAARLHDRFIKFLKTKSIKTNSVNKHLLILDNSGETAKKTAEAIRKMFF